MNFLSLVGFACILAAVVVSPSTSSGAQTAHRPAIYTEDVARFYRVFDAAGGHPTADEIQLGYLDGGTEGLQRFVQARKTTAARIVQAIAEQPELYAGARRCVATLPLARSRLALALAKLSTLYPAAKFPPVTIAIGRGRPVAIGDPKGGVQIGLEALCGVKYYSRNLTDRFVFIIAHEYVHVQQSSHVLDDPNPTVLEQSIVEGSADFIGEIISGGLGNPQFAIEARGRETSIENRFIHDQDKRDMSDWIDNGTMEVSGDMGYWVGYRIVKSYYKHSSDKRRAIREILEMQDPKAFLAKSGWYPGIRLE